VPERVLNRFFVTLILHDLWNEKSVFEVSEKYQINRGIVQNLMTGSATFASNVVNFCEGLAEFWTFAHLIKGMSQRLSHCCVRELLPLMELPAVQQVKCCQFIFDGGN
jgi:POLQ-like helicase